MPDDKPQIEETLSASLDNVEGVSFRGHVDLFDSELGIEGWALNLEDASAQVKLRLIVGSEVVAECWTGRRREDINLGSDQLLAPGFRFGDEIHARLRSNAKLRFEDRVKVQVVGTPYILPSRIGSPLLRDLLGLGRPEGLGGAKSSLDLALKIAALRVEARDWVGQLHRPWPEHLVGYVEALSTDADGFVWLIGWKRAETSCEAPVVIVDQGKAAGGFAYASFQRSDVPIGAQGIVGVLSTEWTPTIPTDFYLHLCGEDRSYLRPSDGLKVLSFELFTSQLSFILPRCQAGHSGSLRRLLARPQSWDLAGEAVGFVAKASLDRVLVLPGFGALAEGWAHCPTQSVAGLLLRIGETTLVGDPATLYTRPRPDLSEAFHAGPESFARAGFTVAFRGPLGDLDLMSAVLKVCYADGTSTNHSVDMTIVQRIDAPGGLEAALNLYPSIAQESFFHEFALAVQNAAASSIPVLQPHIVFPSRRALVFVLGEDRSDAFLLLTQMSAALSAGTEELGVVLIAKSGVLRPEIVKLVGAFREAIVRPLSLFFVEDTRQVLKGLAGALRSLGVSRFVFVEDGMHLTDSGWTAALEAIEDCDSRLHILSAQAENAVDEMEINADAFSWLTDPFAAWITGRPLSLSGGYAFCSDRSTMNEAVLHAGAVRHIARKSESRLMVALDRSLRSSA